jgi:hypothetical protein
VIGRKIADRMPFEAQGRPTLRVHAQSTGEQVLDLQFVVLRFQSFDTDARQRRVVLRSSLMSYFRGILARNPGVPANPEGTMSRRKCWGISRIRPQKIAKILLSGTIFRIILTNIDIVRYIY